MDRTLLRRIDIEQSLEKVVGSIDVVNAAFADQPAGLDRIEHIEQGQATVAITG
jgi:hypothetical protein